MTEYKTFEDYVKNIFNIEPTELTHISPEEQKKKTVAITADELISIWNELTELKLKADRPKWHILAEEPNTLPKEGQKVRVITEEGIKESTLFYDTYYEELAWSNIGFIKVFAWCEIPTYTEE